MLGLRWRLSGISLVSVTFLAAGCASNVIPAQLGRPGVGLGALRAVPRSAGWLSTRAKSGKGLVYVDDNNGNVVYVYDKAALTQGPIGEITSGVSAPNGLAVDRRGNLYVANSDNTNSAYHPGNTTPFRTYSSGISLPFGLVISASTGRLYVANLNSYDVTEYPKGSTTPDVTISFQYLEGNDPFGVALDAQDDLFVTALGYPIAQAYEVPFGSSTPEDLGINGITVMHGIAVDKKGNVIIVDQGGKTIDIFPPGSDTPKKKITDGLIQPILIALNRRQRRLYVADAGSNGYDGGLWVYSYPGGKLLVQVHLPGFTVPEGVAVSPI